ncbi:MAG TPA: PIG-L family deacetylase [Acidimicrobiales bacterium]|jgi:LmbE family N-acetylglucosaminyl deacetylase
MATLVCFHAHPDDEAIATGGLMALAAGAGHRVVLVVATRGEHGEVVEGVLADGEELWQRRVAETHAAADVLGTARVAFLGYVDSGMAGTPTNEAPESFCRADVEEAAERLAALLEEERADLLTCYDEIGGYGHPDHVQVHRVGLRAAAMAGVAVVQATINRDHVRRGIEAQRAAGADDVPDLPDLDEHPEFGMPEAAITHQVDVRAAIDAKRRAMRAHASQIPDSSLFLTMPNPVFTEAFGTEWFITEDELPDAFADLFVPMR